MGIDVTQLIGAQRKMIKRLEVAARIKSKRHRRRRVNSAYGELARDVRRLGYSQRMTRLICQDAHDVFELEDLAKKRNFLHRSTR